jgi:hypothetical protein
VLGERLDVGGISTACRGCDDLRLQVGAQLVFDKLRQRLPFLLEELLLLLDGRVCRTPRSRSVAWAVVDSLTGLLQTVVSSAQLPRCARRFLGGGLSCPYRLREPTARFFHDGRTQFLLQLLGLSVQVGDRAPRQPHRPFQLLLLVFDLGEALLGLPQLVLGLGSKS